MASSSEEALQYVPLKFHTVRSPVVRVSTDGVRAVCPHLGVVFSNRPIRPLQKVSIRIPKFSSTTAARNAFIFFGVSEVDPHLLKGSVTKPNFNCSDFLSLYENPALRAVQLQANVNYVEDGMHIASVILARELAFISFNDVVQKTITDVNRPLWVVFMLAACGNEEIFIEIGDGNNNNISPGTVMSASIITAYYGRVSPTHGFHHFTGRNAFISARNTGLRFRQNHFGSNGYLFLSSHVNAGKGVVLKVLQICNSSEGSIGFGLTSCNPNLLEGHELPDDPDALLDRPEYWIYLPHVAGGIAVNDELCFFIFQSGVVEMSRNGGPPVFLMFVDTSVPLYMFFNLVGSVKEISLMGSVFLPQTATTSTYQQESDEDLSVIEVTFQERRQEVLSASSARTARAIPSVVSPPIPTDNNVIIAGTSRSTVNTGTVATISRSQQEYIGGEAFDAFTRSRNSRSRNFAEPGQQILPAGSAGIGPSIAPTLSLPYQFSANYVHSAGRGPSMAPTLALPNQFPANNVHSSGRGVSMGPTLALSNEILGDNAISAGTSRFPIQQNVSTGQVVPRQANLATPGPSRERSVRHSEGFVCVICMDNRISHIVIDCGHMCLCSQCAEVYDKNSGCPMCRAKITKIIQVYKP